VLNIFFQTISKNIFKKDEDFFLAITVLIKHLQKQTSEQDFYLTNKIQGITQKQLINMDFEDEEEAVQPHYAQKFRAPTDPILLATYELFKPSLQTLNLYSERNREIFAEAFIEGNLDTLGNLCVKSLAKLGIRGISPTLQASPQLMRIFYDALDVELPLR